MGALVFVQVLFGVNYVISKEVVDAFPPLLWASLRAWIAAGMMFLYGWVTHRKHPKLTKDFLMPLVLFSLFAVIINQGTFLVGLHYTTSTNSAIINTMIPVFTLLIVTMRGQEPMTLNRGIGFILAFAGVLVLRNVEHFTLSDDTFFGDMLMLVNCLSFGIFLSISKPYFEKYDRFWATTWIFVFGSIGLTAISLPEWMDWNWPVMTPKLFAFSAYAVIGGTLLTYFLQNWALAYTSSSSVALFVYIQPVITAVLAFFWFDEAITLRTVASSALIFTGVALVVSKRDTSRAAVQAAIRRIPRRKSRAKAVSKSKRRKVA
jgi:drug/metabolite transporter (DMT)-like permease